MPKPLKPLLIVFSILIFAGIFALSWNQWLRPAADAVANGDMPGSGQGAGKTSQSAQTESGQAATADSGTASNASGQPAESAATAQSGTVESQTASSATDEQPAAVTSEAGADTAARGDKIAALTPDAGTGSAPGAVRDAEASAAPDSPDSPGAAVQPSFDIVRVEPSGDTVIAGRAVPNAVVELLSNGSIIAMTTADAAGEFVLVLEKPLAAGGHDLALRTLGGEGVSIYSKANVAVAVPEVPSGEVLVVMNEPGAASEILAKPDEAASVETGTEVAATGETVIAVAPSADTLPADTLPAETQIAAAPAAPASGSTSGQQSQTAEPAEPAVTGEPETPPQTAETAEPAPVVPVKPAEVMETAPTVQAAPEPPAQTAEASPAVPEPQPQMAETATVEKPAEGSGAEVADQVADGGQVAAKVASAAPVPLGVEAVEIEGDTLYAAGTASPGEIIRVYIDGEPTGETTALDNGRWLLETETKVPTGTVIVRADQLAPGRTKVVARAEVSFTRQLDMAVLVPTAAGGVSAGATAEGELPKPNAVIIRRGDNLWTISRRTYGRGIRYTTIYTANKDQIRNPHMIFPGQVFMLPVGDKTWTQ
jgi:nucleoid-associated protein YgaU